MNPAEAAKLLGHAAAFDNRTVGEVDARAWAASLRDVPLDADALAAVARYYGTPPKDPGQRLWIQPHHVRTHRKAIRAQRLEDFQYEPTPGGAEAPRQYLARRRAQLSEVGSGHRPPHPRIALTGDPHSTVLPALAGIGRPVSGEDGEALPQPRPLSVTCPTCGARVGQHCKAPRGVRRRVHSARRRLAEGRPNGEDPAEIERRRAASARFLADHQPEESA